jgi:signal transduction histidine kinase
MLQDTERLNNLITSILDVAGLEQKKLAYDFKVYNADHILEKLIKEALIAYKLKAKSYMIKGKHEGEVVIDERAMKIVFNNLTDNAIKYSPGKVHIAISLTQNAKNYIVDVSDRGIGLLNKEQKLIFKKFERIYKADNPTVKGTGLGLYWVREIVKAHGGKIIVSSAGQDQGTTFRIELPIYQTSKKRLTNRLLRITSRRNQGVEIYDE